jgi:serine/threonine-protein kinase
MKRPGPLLTLLAGLVLGLFMLTFNATSGTKTASSSSSVEAPSASPKKSANPSPTQKPTVTPSPTPSKSPVPNASYAGRTDDDTASVAVSIRDGKAVAYFCDGRYKEAWLRGPVKDDGTMKLTAPNGAVLDGKLQQGKKILGTVKDEGLKYAFTADKAVKPSGLWRATAKVRGAKIDGGWIVLPNGRQTGIVTRDGKATAAPRIDPETGAVTVDGQQLTAQPVTP